MLLPLRDPGRPRRSSAATSACPMSSGAGPGSAASSNRARASTRSHLAAGTEILLMVVSVGVGPARRSPPPMRSMSRRRGEPARRFAETIPRRSTGRSRESTTSTNSTTGSSSAASSRSGRIADWIDRRVIDGLVNGVGGLARGVSRLAIRLRRGRRRRRRQRDRPGPSRPSRPSCAGSRPAASPTTPWPSSSGVVLVITIVVAVF